MNELGSIPLTEGSGWVGPGRIVVTFDFTNPRWIPRGIPLVERPGDREVDSDHALGVIALGRPELAQLGRHRTGRVDTGIPIIRNLEGVHAAILRRGLTNCGYRLVDCHYCQHIPRPKAGTRSRTPKWKVCLTFQWVGEGEFEGNLVQEDGQPNYNGKTVAALRELANTTWAFAHVWDNRQAGNNAVAINFVGRQPEAKPQHAIAVRHNRLTAVRVAQAIPEDEE